MPACCIKQCGARRNTNQPTLTLHRFPVNETLRKKWIDIIRIENINPRHKIWYVCSRHFNEASFNRTLNVIRLRDGAVPLSSHPPVQICSQPTTSLQQTSSAEIPNKTGNSVLHETQNMSTSTIPMELPDDSANKYATILEIQQQNRKIKNLTEKCNLLRKTVKRLNEKVRRQDQKIARFSNIIKDLHNKNFVNNKETNILEQLLWIKKILKK